MIRDAGVRKARMCRKAFTSIRRKNTGDFSWPHDFLFESCPQAGMSRRAGHRTGGLERAAVGRSALDPLRRAATHESRRDADLLEQAPTELLQLNLGARRFELRRDEPQLRRCERTLHFPELDGRDRAHAELL